MGWNYFSAYDECENQAKGWCKVTIPNLLDPGSEAADRPAEVAPTPTYPDKRIPTQSFNAPRVAAPVEQKPAPARVPSYNFNAGSFFLGR